MSPFSTPSSLSLVNQPPIFDHLQHSNSSLFLSIIYESNSIISSLANLLAGQGPSSTQQSLSHSLFPTGQGLCLDSCLLNQLIPALRILLHHQQRPAANFHLSNQFIKACLSLFLSELLLLLPRIHHIWLAHIADTSIIWTAGTTGSPKIAFERIPKRTRISPPISNQSLTE